MPVYNGERYIREALDSVLTQTFNNFELIISDNASSDGTRQICEEYCRRDSRVRYIRQPKNIGAVENFKFVTSEAIGEFIKFVAHDDVLIPCCLEVLEKHLASKPSTLVITGDVEIVNEHGGQLRVERLDHIRDTISWRRRQIYFFCYPANNEVHAIYGLMRSEYCKRAMSSMPVLGSAFDCDVKIMARIAAMGEIYSINFVLTRYRWHSDSTGLSDGRSKAGKNLVSRVLTRQSDRFRTRSDQLSTLLLSPEITLIGKLWILLNVMLSYVSFFVRESLTLPARLLRLISGLRQI
jgi:glycosyltransferase involved in cell wall biosynthesis